MNYLHCKETTDRVFYDWPCRVVKSQSKASLHLIAKQLSNTVIPYLPPDEQIRSLHHGFNAFSFPTKHFQAHIYIM